ncbi:MAG TPA: pyridoxal phosphate-dependent aminotransferase, partial [Polyangiaceae bacterium]|nr:pyridoxal phosphate-dependent aminotransferase [Polyangiaceae bacterium]
AFADVRGLLGMSAGGKTLATDDDVAMWLLHEAHAATVAGSPFGAPGYLRFSYACADHDIVAGLESIRSAVTAARG